MSATIISGLTLYVRASTRLAEREIQITAKKFDFTPDTITLKKGEPVVLVVSSQDASDSTHARLGFAPTSAGATAGFLSLPTRQASSPSHVTYSAAKVMRT
jgi:hypothetical protein